MKKQKQAYLYAILSVLLWSTAASAFKITLRYLTIIQLLFFSSLTAAMASFIIMLFQGKIKLLTSFSVRDYLHSAILGMLNPFIYYIILFKAYTLLPAQEAQPLNFIWPIMIVILSIPLLKQKISIKSIGAIFISFVGVIVISTHGNLLNLKFENPYGVILALSSAVVWALFFIFNIKDKRDEIAKLFLSFGFGFIFTFILFLKDPLLPNWKGLAGAVYIGLFEMGITFIFWLKALKLSCTTVQVNNLIYLTPFLSLIFINFVIRERIVFSSIIGLILIVIGIVFQERNKVHLE
ncbi:MAG: DMT family transporter [Candidatus Cloacimonetes bacterium]|nr:DMT family transporter [Candidatus Cloacimonadota bacterium]